MPLPLLPALNPNALPPLLSLPLLPAQVGGLADVVTSLAKAHQATGTLTEIILPKYDCIN